MIKRLLRIRANQLEEILAYSRVNFPGTAERFGTALLDHLELLKTFPYMGSQVSRRPGVRQLVHTPILIYYVIDERRKTIEVLHFRHGARPDLG
jgi:plasmid stabilization system protein ParE